jgi:hypothetical protein
MLLVCVLAAPVFALAGEFPSGGAAGPVWAGDKAFPSPEQMKRIGLTQEDIKHLDGVLAFDLDTSRKFDLSADQIRRSSSYELARHFAWSPMTINFLLYDDVNLGITRSARSCATLSALLGRKDTVAGITRFYLDTPIPRTSREAGKTSCALQAADEILMYPLVFDRITKPEARRILKHLCGRYHSLEAAKKTADRDHPLYGAAFVTTYQLASMLETRLREQGPAAVTAPRPQQTPQSEAALFEECEKLLREPQK